MSEQTYCFVLSPPWLFLTYHLQHNARCQTQTVMPIPPTAKRLCHLQPKSASGSFFFGEVWSKRKQSVNLWWNIFAWAENVKCESGFGFVFQPGRFKLEGLLSSFLEPSNPFHGWPGLARVWAAARSRKNMKSMYLKKKEKKASDAALRVLKKVCQRKSGYKRNLHTSARTLSLTK